MKVDMIVDILCLCSYSFDESSKSRSIKMYIWIRLLSTFLVSVSFVVEPSFACALLLLHAGC
jgi:hypothetical protein